MKMNFSQRLKALRREKKITQQDLAEYLDVSRATVAGYETKEKQPDFEKMIKIANFFNVSLDYLIIGKNQKDQNLESDHTYKLDLKNLTNDDIKKIEEYADLIRFKNSHKSHK